MKTWVKGILLALLAVVLIVLAGVAWYLYKAVPVGTGYAAKYLCSSVFISKRSQESVFQEDITPVNILARITDTEVDHERKMVIATAFGILKSKAIYREGCGCTLVVGTTEEALRKQKVPAESPVRLPEDQPWPTGRLGPVDPMPEGVDPEKIKKAIDRAFSEPGFGKPRKTRAVVLVYDGHLIAERYAPGFHKDMPLIGWSMSKSVTNALVGIQVRKGALRVDGPAPVSEWRAKGDPRQAITLNHLLQMQSGLEFEEVYEPLTDVTNMLYASNDFAAYAASKSLDAEPGEKWHYSSGTSTIVSRIVRHSVKGAPREYLSFPRRELFDKLGMSSAILEPDASGTFEGSSYTFATARDWARFGLLYLQDGVWQGERILPQGWVKYTTTPASKAPQGKYGAHFYLNAGTPGNPEDRLWPRLPRDAFAARGFQGQRLMIIPSRKLVAVRLGLTVESEALDFESFILDVLAALPVKFDPD